MGDCTKHYVVATSKSNLKRQKKIPVVIVSPRIFELSCIPAIRLKFALYMSEVHGIKGATLVKVVFTWAIVHYIMSSYPAKAI
jgi:hypothetical protein